MIDIDIYTIIPVNTTDPLTVISVIKTDFGQLFLYSDSNSLTVTSVSILNQQIVPSVLRSILPSHFRYYNID